MEQVCAINFKERIEQTSAQQVIYLSGIVNGAAAIETPEPRARMWRPFYQARPLCAYHAARRHYCRFGQRIV